MNEFKADLHCHSTFSDGTLTPHEILELAKLKNLQAISITDHDNIDAYKNLKALQDISNIDIIPGVELSAQLNSHNVHILGYSFNLNSSQLLNFCHEHQIRRTKRNNLILQLLSKQSLDISEKELKAKSPSGSVGRPHIAQIMVEKGYVSSIKEAFIKYIGDQKICYAEQKKPSVKETIDLIHSAGGLAFIAHPHLISHSDVRREVFKLDFDGIEGRYANFDAQKNQRWLDIAKQKKWLVSGGSDFHGAVKPEISLGASYTDSETFAILKDKFKQNN